MSKKSKTIERWEAQHAGSIRDALAAYGKHPQKRTFLEPLLNGAQIAVQYSDDLNQAILVLHGIDTQMRQIDKVSELVIPARIKQAKERQALEDAEALMRGSIEAETALDVELPDFGVQDLEAQYEDLMRRRRALVQARAIARQVVKDELGKPETEDAIAEAYGRMIAFEEDPDMTLAEHAELQGLRDVAGPILKAIYREAVRAQAVPFREDIWKATMALWDEAPAEMPRYADEYDRQMSPSPEEIAAEKEALAAKLRRREAIKADAAANARARNPKPEQEGDE